MNTPYYFTNSGNKEEKRVQYSSSCLLRTNIYLRWPLHRTVSIHELPHITQHTIQPLLNLASMLKELLHYATRYVLLFQLSLLIIRIHYFGLHDSEAYHAFMMLLWLHLPTWPIPRHHYMGNYGNMGVTKSSIFITLCTQK